MSLVTAGQVVVPGAVLQPGWLKVVRGWIAEVGQGVPAEPAEVGLPGAALVPGFIDVHVHGGGGGSFLIGDQEEAVRVVEFHRRHGTTTMVASLISATPAGLQRTMAALGELVGGGLLAGVHLEGPWLSRDYCGAHDPALLRRPDPAEVAQVLRGSRGAVRVVTLAPELPGGLEAVRRIVDAGAVVAVGHSGATYAQTREALAHGASLGTHLFNAMAPFHHRDPGPAGALLEEASTVVELIADGVHVHPAMLRHAVRLAGPDRVALVTDAIAAAGAGDGAYRLGELPVQVTVGVARLAGSGAIAGSTLTMDAALQFMVQEVGVPLDAAVRMAATTPARLLGRSDIGAIEVGRRADLVALDADLQVQAVMVAGSWVEESGAVLNVEPVSRGGSAGAGDLA